VKFEILIGPRDGEIIEVAEEKFGIGRGHDNRVSVPCGRMVSKYHGKISRKGERVIFADTGNDGKGSMHGTMIKRKGGEPVEFKGEEKEIFQGDVLVLGKCIWLKFLG
jgi:hypothetical protein